MLRAACKWDLSLFRSKIYLFISHRCNFDVPLWRVSLAETALNMEWFDLAKKF